MMKNRRKKFRKKKDIEGWESHIVEDKNNYKSHFFISFPEL
jgi:hypothetical protein